MIVPKFDICFFVCVYKRQQDEMTKNNYLKISRKKCELFAYIKKFLPCTNYMSLSLSLIFLKLLISSLE